jgi:hypothetical protein
MPPGIRIGPECAVDTHGLIHCGRPGPAMTTIGLNMDGFKGEPRRYVPWVYQGVAVWLDDKGVVTDMITMLDGEPVCRRTFAGRPTKFGLVGTAERSR